MIDQSKLHEKISSIASIDKISGAYLLAFYFNDLPNKEQAWNDLAGLAQKGYGDEKKLAAASLGQVFKFAPDKDRAWNDLITTSKIVDVQNLIACTLETSVEFMHNKDKAWDDLIQLIGNGYGDYAKIIANFLGRIFERIPNKDKAWKDLIRLSQSGSSDFQKNIINSIVMAFEHNPNKAQVWGDFILLPEKRYIDIKQVVPNLKILFEQVPDKINAWNDLLALLSKSHGDDRNSIVKLLGDVFKYMPDNQKALDDLIKLSQDGSYDIKPLAASALRTAIDYNPIRSIDISSRIKEIVRIAVAQLGFELSTSFPPQLVEKELGKRKIFSALKMAKQYKADILCLPELCMSEEWLKEIRNGYPEMIIIAGSYYDKENQNVSEVLIGSLDKIPPQIKKNPSVSENSNFSETRMNSGECINVYNTKYGLFSVLICRDFGKFATLLRGKIDMIFVPSYNKANARFHKEADNHVTNSPSYVIISNTANFGGTSIFGQLNKSYLNELKKIGYKKDGDNSYKLCEIGEDEEGLIIADFNLIHKSPPLQTPIDAAEELKLQSVTNIRKYELLKDW